MSNAVLSTGRLRGRERSRGQSLVEFALIFPVLMLLLLVAIDFGRVYLGWINLQQMSRIAAADAAGHATAWLTPGDPAERAKYQQRIARDAEQINCRLPGPPAPAAPKIPDPVFAGGTALGAHVTVGIDCEFSVVTPIISTILGGTVLVSAETTFPVDEGAVATVPGGGVPISPPPVAKFVGSPRSGWAPLIVKFTDTSTGSPTSWTWDFSVAPSGPGTGTASMATALSQGPHTVTYNCVGTPGDTCLFGVSLRVKNGGGISTLSTPDYITVTVPPPTGPIAEFTGTPLSGLEPVNTTFQFVDLRAGAVTYTNWEWDFTSDGTWDATGLTSVHNYPTEGSYDVTLRVTDNTGATNTLRKNGYVVVNHKVCTVPDFFNVKKNQAQARWSSAGFTTVVQFLSGQGNYTIKTQTPLVGGTIDPQPNGCASAITVGP
jgi:PKD repeat protein